MKKGWRISSALTCKNHLLSRIQAHSILNINTTSKSKTIFNSIRMKIYHIQSTKGKVECFESPLETSPFLSRFCMKSKQHQGKDGDSPTWQEYCAS
jgi:hypothetical protein